MGSVKFKDLKAYVRYDGSGRVVAGSLVFRKKKPKNGRWSEISSNLCCNANPSSTTTTTTQGGGGGVTPTAFVQPYWLNTNDSCNTTTAGDLLFYSASTILQSGMTIFQDAALTIPVTEGLVIYYPMLMTKYVVGAGGALSVYNCPPPVTLYNADYQFGGVGDPCVGTGQWNIPLEFPSGFCTSASVNLASGYTWAQYGINIGATLKVKDPNSNQYAQVNVQSGSAGYNFGCNNC